MKYIIFSTILIFTFCSQPKNESDLINGDLYYTWFNIGSFYNLPDSLLEKALSLQNSKEEADLIAEDSAGYMYFKLLQEHDILRSPWINIRIKEDSIIKIFMQRSDYEVFTKVSHEQLLIDDERINVTASVQHLNENLFKCIELVEVKRLPGQTFITNRNRKFKVSDYQ